MCLKNYKPKISLGVVKNSGGRGGKEWPQRSMWQFGRIMEIFYISTLVLVTQQYIFLTKYTELLTPGHKEIYYMQMISQHSCLLAYGKQEQHLQSRTSFQHILHLSSHWSSSSSFETLRPSGKWKGYSQSPRSTSLCRWGAFT